MREKNLSHLNFPYPIVQWQSQAVWACQVSSPVWQSGSLAVWQPPPSLAVWPPPSLAVWPPPTAHHWPLQAEHSTALYRVYRELCKLRFPLYTLSLLHSTLSTLYIDNSTTLTEPYLLHNAHKKLFTTHWAFYTEHLVLLTEHLILSIDDTLHIPHYLLTHSRFSGSANSWAPSMENGFQVATGPGSRD